LSLDNGERCEATTAIVIVHLRSALEETAVEIEDVTRISLTSRRTAEEE
jgi:hypothetical protein